MVVFSAYGFVLFIFLFFFVRVYIQFSAKFFLWLLELVAEKHKSFHYYFRVVILVSVD